MTLIWRWGRGIVGIAGLAILASLLSWHAAAAPYAAVVMDARSGEILHARNHDTRLHPASLTKMMTLYIAFEAIQNGEITLDTRVTVSRNAASEVCSCLGLRAGQQIALRYLIRAAAVRSGNDAATTIGEAISGSEAAFAQRMTRTARAMGMHNTTFRNAHGLTHREHLSTARDMTTLARQLFYDFPQYYNLFSRRSTHAGVGEVHNTNRRFLAAYRGADGIKTGYTRAAGFNLVGSAERGGTRIIATIFGGNSVAHRNARMAELLDMGFSRAPAQAAVRRPPRPAYDGAPASGRAGRVFRANLAVETSARPRLNPRHGPRDPETFIALRDSIDTVVAEAGSSSIVGRAPQPGAGDDNAIALPPTRPGSLLDLDDAPAADDRLRAATSAAVAEALARKEEESVPQPAATAQTDPPEPEPAALQLTSSAHPVPRPEEVVQAALTNSDGAEAADTREVVTRAGAGGASDWAINVGRFGTQFAAERALMQTALVELTVLDDASRNVSRGAAGFDAVFSGLSRDAADRACRRLQARDRHCVMIAP